MQKTLILLATLLCFGAQAEEAAPLKVIFGVARPPYVMEKPLGGISVELVREIFKRMGESFVPFSGSNKRVEVEIKMGRVDVAVEVQPTEPELFYSNRFIAYRNYIVTRRQQRIGFSGQWSDLHGLKVCAWQNARENLGAEFAATSQNFARYTEHSSQRTQVEEWLLERCDAILIDATLLNWQWRQLHEQNPKFFKAVDSDVTYTALPQGHELWWYVGFRSKKLRDRFDTTLAQLHADGSYARIRERFTSANSPTAPLLP